MNKTAHVIIAFVTVCMTTHATERVRTMWKRVCCQLSDGCSSQALCPEHIILFIKRVTERNIAAFVAVHIAKNNVGQLNSSSDRCVSDVASQGIL